ncbi:hypothetical protein [Deinococcus cellulosilyticus]|uniref:Uncharacterized protein n=1 Tax=Deinococcus cellulosilyticus (strain DSM 18568 / NBRC 106333 / KACC 11606 / 5516J-15) TaxID=1223518 RepID=A0A511MX22_DEIC1|nr:hypothetical protein [Deinococcus cellulosilyticus]GEM44921.1 hypothetical protein DC3_05560 [Deinococcus cellulosilyticus NBRC 106333 = KACC 11606]
MSLALFIVPESELKVDAFIDGKALAHAIEDLQDLSERLGVTPLEEFMDHTEALDLLEDPDEDDLNEDDFAAEEQMASEDREWFDAAEALRTVSALLEALKSSPEQSFGGFTAEDVQEDLQDLQKVLQACQSEGVRFHLALDF